MSEPSRVWVSGMHQPPGVLDISSIRSTVELRELEHELAAVHATSPRLSPFTTPSFMINYVEHDEYARASDEILVLLAREGYRLVGYLALRLRKEEVLNFAHLKVEALLTHDSERPHVVSAATDEARCARAFLQHMVASRWDMLEMMEQDATSPFFAAAQELDDRRFYVRRFAGEPVAVIANSYPSLAHYYGAMTKKFRQNLRRSARDLFALDGIEYLASRDARGAAYLLESYLEMEGASWKAGGNGTISRHPERLSFFRHLAAERLPFDISVELFMHGGRPIAGLINGAFGSGFYALQIAHDARYDDVAPGSMLLFLAMERVIDDGFEFYNLLHGSTYYKTRWLADVLETESVQIFRRGSVPYFKARLGELRRAVKNRGNTAVKIASFNSLKRTVMARLATRPVQAALTRPLTSELEGHVPRLAPQLTRLTRTELVARMPFAVG
ncbi:MAG: GNAT family N-acetyltransferase [Clostridia bacterium]|nr:GNAT family N-acetyltransferase [Deltaproteobacteria bacterium]